MIPHEPLTPEPPRDPARQYPKTNWRAALFGAGIGLAGVIFGQQIGKVFQQWGGHPLIAGLRAEFSVFTWWDVPIAVPAFFFAVLVHELGHVSGGVLAGMRFLMLIVGPMRLRRTVSGFKLDWFWRTATFGGLAITLPERHPTPKAAWLLLIAGGPAASLVLTAASVALGAAADGRLAACAWITASISMFLFLVTAFPARAGGFMTDGRQFLEVVRGGEAVEHRNVLTAIYAMGLTGTRPRERDAALYERALRLTGTDPVRDVGTWLLAYQRALDQRDLEAAGGWIDAVAAHHDDYPEGFRQALAVEVAFFAARYRREPERAQAWLERAEGGIVETASRSLAHAALAWACGRVDEAQRWIDQGRKELTELSDAGLVASVEDELDALSAELRRTPG